MSHGYYLVPCGYGSTCGSINKPVGRGILSGDKEDALYEIHSRFSPAAINRYDNTAQTRTNSRLPRYIVSDDAAEVLRAPSDDECTHTVTGTMYGFVTEMYYGDGGGGCNIDNLTE